MQVFPASDVRIGPCSLAIGSFDGVHLGHRHVIETAMAFGQSRDLPTAVYTFDVPPKHVFGRARMLSDLPTKTQRIRRIGPDCLVVATFDRAYAARSAAEFVEELRALSPVKIFVGADFRFGARQGGDVAMLKRHFDVNVVAAKTCAAGQRISSTRIRDLIARSEYEAANRLLG